MCKKQHKSNRMNHIPSHQQVGLIILFLAPIYLLQSYSFSGLDRIVSTPVLQVTATLTPSAPPTRYHAHQQTIPPTPKDVWDKIDSLSGLVSGIVIAVIGGLATYLYRERERAMKESRDKHELSILELQATQGFFPYLLSKNDTEVELAVLAISLLGSPKLATNLAAYIDRSGARKAFASIIKNNDLNIPYKFKSFKEIHDIQPNGDLKFERISEIEAIEAPISYAFLSIGVTHGNLSEIRNVSATNPTLNKELVWIVGEDNLTRKLIIAFLDPPAIIGRNSTAKIQLHWPGPYTQLVNEKQDNGRIRLDHEVDTLELHLIAPKDLHFANISFDNLNPSIELSIDVNNRSIAKIISKNVRVGVYSFTMTCFSQ